MMIGEKDATQTVADVMSCDVVTIRSTDSIGDLLNLMESKKVSSIPVVDNEQCVGIVTATDVARLVLRTNEALHSDYPHYEDCLWAVDLARRKLKEDPVVEIMHSGIITVAPDEPISVAAKKIMDEKVHHLAVQKDGRLLGFLSSCDFLRTFR